MIIRQDQIEVFDAGARDRFVNEAAAHITQFAPKHAEVLGPKGTSNTARIGIDRARQYGFVHPGPVHFFLDLMYILGSEFDTDPQYPWAAQILKDSTIPGEMPRADRLHERCVKYLDTVAGPNNEYALAALRRIKTIQPGTFGGNARESNARMASALKSMYPQKVEYLGNNELNALIGRATGRANARALTSQAAAILFTALEFTLGHAFERDPLYPWIASTLDNPDLTNQEDKIRLLHRKIMAYVDNAVTYLEQQPR